MLSSSANFSLSWAIFCSFRFQRKEEDEEEDVFNPANTETWLLQLLRVYPCVCERKRVRESDQSLDKLKNNTHMLHFHTQLPSSSSAQDRQSCKCCRNRQVRVVVMKISHTSEHLNA